MSGKLSPGKRFLITTRPEKKVREYEIETPFEIINCPLTNMKEIEPGASEIKKVRNFKPEVIVLTSEYGAELFFRHYAGNMEMDNSLFIAIGNSTAGIIRQKGFETLIPPKRDSSGIAELINETVEKNARIGLFRSDNPNRALDKSLNEWGYSFIDVTLYEIHETQNDALSGYLKDEKCYGVILTSSMETRIFRKYIEKSGISGIVEERIRVFPIGSKTLNAMLKENIRPSKPYGESDLEELITMILEDFLRNK